jgi:hypothetical protein
MRACKLSMIGSIVVLFCLTICVSLSTNIWLSKWTDKAKMEKLRNNTSSSNQIHDMNIYSALGIAQGNKVYLNDLFHPLFKVFLRLSCT